MGGIEDDTTETWLSLFAIVDLQTKNTQACLEDLISDVKQGTLPLWLSPVALLETINAFPKLHGA